MLVTALRLAAKTAARMGALAVVTRTGIAALLVAGRLGRVAALWGTLLAGVAALGAALPVISALALRGVGTLAQELEVVHLDFGSEALIASLVGPLAGADLAFDEDLTALVDEFFDEVGVATPGDDVVPFRVLAGFAVAVAIAFRGGETEGGYLGVALGALGIGIEVTDFGVISNVTDQHDFVECHNAICLVLTKLAKNPQHRIPVGRF